MNLAAQRETNEGNGYDRCRKESLPSSIADDERRTQHKNGKDAAAATPAP